MSLRRNEVHCVFIFDGQCPVEKLKERKRRKDTKDQISIRIDNLRNDIDNYLYKHRNDKEKDKNENDNTEMNQNMDTIMDISDDAENFFTYPMNCLANSKKKIFTFHPAPFQYLL